MTWFCAVITLCSLSAFKTYAAPGDVSSKSMSNDVLIDSCLKGRHASCATAGLIFINGPKKDPAKAAEYFRRSCDAGHVDGCGYLGELLLVGVPDRGPKKDIKRGIHLLKRSCDNAPGLGHCGVLGRTYDDGDIVKRDIHKARRYYVLDCTEHNDLSCSFAERLGAKIDPARRKKFSVPVR